MSIVQIQASNFLFTVLNLCCKDKNKEKEAGNGTFFLKKNMDIRAVVLDLLVEQSLLTPDVCSSNPGNEFFIYCIKFVL